MKLTEEQIKQGLDKAYKEAGHNAYFGNGFEAGIRFAQEQLKNCNLQNVSFSDERAEFCDTEYDDFDTKDDLYAAGYDGDW